MSTRAERGPVTAARSMPAVESRVSFRSASATAVLEPGSPVLEAAQHAFVSAMQSTTLIAGGVMVLAAIVAFTLIPNNKDAVTADH